MWRRLLLVCTVIASQAAPAHAGIFRKTPKPDPNQRVPELLKVLKDHGEERKRADAAEELRDYDSRAFPDLMPALIDAMQNDPSSLVRSQAANSIGRLRPISQQAGFALEQTLQNDSSWRVRVAARTTLWEYHLLGYRSGKPPEKVLEQTEEPPLADPPAVATPSKPVPQELPKPAPPKQDRPWFPRPIFPLFRRDPPRIPSQPTIGDSGAQPAIPRLDPVSSGRIEQLPAPAAPARPAQRETSDGPALGTPPGPPMEGPALGPMN